MDTGKRFGLLKSRIIAVMIAALSMSASSRSVLADNRNASLLQRLPPTISGTVRLPDGSPAADAPVILFWHKPYAKTTTNSDGEFSIDLDVQKVKAGVGDDWIRMAIASTIDGYGPGWQILGKLESADSVTIQLVDDLPIEGRILNQQGQPVQGAKVTILSMHRSEDESLDGFLQASRDQPTRVWLHERDSMLYLSPEAVLKLQGIKNQRRPTATTDKSGQFRLSGFGSERSLLAKLEGPGITSDTFYIVTRSEIAARWKRGGLSRATKLQIESGASMSSVYAANFHHLAAPAKSLTGTLTDALTGSPVEGMNVAANFRGTNAYARTHSDADGKFELEGMPAQGRLRLTVLNPGGKPYLDAQIERDVKATERIGHFDLKLDQGIRVSGKVVDAKTGQPVKGNVGYLTWIDNPHLDALHQPFETFNMVSPDEAGDYELIVPPGPGVIVFRAYNDRQFAAAESKDFGFPMRNDRYFRSGNRGSVPAHHFHFARRIEPKPGQSNLRQDVTVGTGLPLKVTVVKPDGSGIESVMARDVEPGRLSELRGGRVVIRGLERGEKRTAFFRDRDEQFAGVFELQLTGNGDTDSVRLRLKETATVTGRLASQNGRPLTRWGVAARSAGTLAVEKTLRPVGMFEFDETTTDADGYFRLKGLPAGVSIEIVAINVGRGERPEPVRVEKVTLRPGRNRDLGKCVLGQ